VQAAVNDEAPKAAEDKQNEEKEDKPETNEAASTDAEPAANEVAEDAPASVWISTQTLFYAAVTLQFACCCIPWTDVLALQFFYSHAYSNLFVFNVIVVQ